MTTEQTMTDAPSAPPPAAPAPQPAAPTITPEVQALIEAAKSSAYNAGAKDARLALEAKFKSPPSAPPRKLFQVSAPVLTSSWATKASAAV